MNSGRQWIIAPFERYRGLRRKKKWTLDRLAFKPMKEYQQSHRRVLAGLRTRGWVTVKLLML